MELDAFRNSHKQSDDVTLIEVKVEAPPIQAQLTSHAVAPRAASAWRANFEFGFDTLKSYDPLPMMMQVLLETQRLHQYKQRIYMVLAELFVNALEHGLLRLDSRIKETPGGFGAYYKEKEQRLADMHAGVIQVELTHEAQNNGGRLTIRVTDSGDGFDFAERLKRLNSAQTVHGRGLMLVSSLCESLRHEGKGNVVEAGFRWYLHEDTLTSVA